MANESKEIQAMDRATGRASGFFTSLLNDAIRTGQAPSPMQVLELGMKLSVVAQRSRELAEAEKKREV